MLGMANGTITIAAERNIHFISVTDVNLLIKLLKNTRYEAKQKEIEAKILIEQSKSIVRISASDIRKYYKDALRYEARQATRVLPSPVFISAILP